MARRPEAAPAAIEDMAGTDHRDETAAQPAPVVILVRPQLGMNIGTAARAMLNCGLTEMRLVAPRDGWPNGAAYTAASRADRVLNEAKLFATTAEAIADLHRVFATTARPRGMLKPVATPRHAAGAMHAEIAAGRRVGILFGPERTGLENDEAALADTLVSVPLHPGFASLNLAQAVLVIGYEWFTAGDATAPIFMPESREGLATKDDLLGLFRHLELELDTAGYFTNIAEKRDAILRNIRNIFQRVPLLAQDIRTLRGVVKSLSLGRARRSRRPHDDAA